MALTRLCAWCKRRIGPDGTPTGPPLACTDCATHGICNDCRRVYFPPKDGNEMYVYIKSEKACRDNNWHELWTVGFYDPQGKWQPESDHKTAQEAADRIAYLNGGKHA